MLTALINAMILLPFIFLFSPSAFINDKFSRTNVIRYSSLAAVVISAGILLSYMTGMFALSFVLTLILAAQSAVYSPAKLFMVILYLVLLPFLSSLKRIMWHQMIRMKYYKVFG